MGGQDGYSRDMLDYSSDSNALMAGLKYQKRDKIEFGVDFSSAGLGVFEFFQNYHAGAFSEQESVPVPVKRS